MMKKVALTVFLVGGFLGAENAEAGKKLIPATEPDDAVEGDDFFEQVTSHLPSFALIAKDQSSRAKFIEFLDPELQSVVSEFFERPEDELVEFVDALTSDPEGFKLIVQSSEKAMNLFKQFSQAVEEGYFAEEFKQYGIPNSILTESQEKDEKEDEKKEKKELTEDKGESKKSKKKDLSAPKNNKKNLR